MVRDGAGRPVAGARVATDPDRTLTGSQTARATLTLDDDDPASGELVMIVRTEVGGVAWAVAEIAVR